MSSRLRVTAVITLILLVLTGVQYYIGWHGRVFLSTVFPMETGVWYWIGYWIIAFSYLIARMGSRVLPALIYRTLKTIGSYWFAVLLYSVLLLPIMDLAAWLLRFSSVDRQTVIVTLGASFLLILAALLIRGSWNAWNPITRKYELTIPKQAGDLKQLRVAVASDLHLGTIVGNAYLEVLVGRINALQPDLILFPGDVIDDEIEPFIRQGMGEIMKRLQARLGKYAVLGNHEYIGGHIAEFEKQMNASGIELLMDRYVKIADSFYLVGRKDKAVERFGAGGRLQLNELLQGADKSLPLIMMDHQPYQLDKAASSGIDVMLSGHTHRGQMTPNHWITGKLFELDWGYLQKGGLHAIVSSGFGTWGPPIRLGSRSEIIELVIRFEAA